MLDRRPTSRMWRTPWRTRKISKGNTLYREIPHKGKPIILIKGSPGRGTLCPPWTRCAPDIDTYWQSLILCTPIPFLLAPLLLSSEFCLRRGAPAYRESIEVRAGTRVSFRGYPQKGGGAVFSWLLSLAVLVLCVISPLQLPFLDTDLYWLPKPSSQGAREPGSFAPWRPRSRGAWCPGSRPTSRPASLSEWIIQSISRSIRHIYIYIYIAIST